jgi:phospholipid/cholesterol/gamma-HCH transport system substrate-binding protein
MNRNVIETVMGAIVLLVAVTFLVFVYTSSDVRQVSGYEVLARFDRVDGLVPGSDVRVSGIKVGSVVDQSLDPETYLAVVRLSVSDAIRLPTDTSARVLSDGLLGSMYLDLVPGADEAMIGAGGEITTTQGSVNLIDLVGRYMFSGAGDKPTPGGNNPAPEPRDIPSPTP